MKNYINKITLKWILLLKISNSPIIKQTYIFIIIIPILSGFLNTYNQGINQVAQIILHFSNISLNISLPFNKFILYISSTLFVIGRIIIAITIPTFILDLPKYKNFLDLKLTREDLIRYYPNMEYNNNMTNKEIYDILHDIFNNKNNLLRKWISFIFLLGSLGFLYLFLEGGYKVFVNMFF